MSDQTKSFIRSLLKMLGLYLVQRGLTDSNHANAIIDAAMDILGGSSIVWGFAWSWWHHKNNPTVPPAPPAGTVSSNLQ